MMAVPSRPRWSIRRCISSSGTGSDTLSYSLQYAQARLQNRAGTNLRQHRMRSRSQRARHHRVLAHLAPAAIARPLAVDLRGSAHLYY